MKASALLGLLILSLLLSVAAAEAKRLKVPGISSRGGVIVPEKRPPEKKGPVSIPKRKLGF